MRQARGARALHRVYSDRQRVWGWNAIQARWNRVRAARGEPLVPQRSVPLAETPAAITGRRVRELRRRRRDYNRAHGLPPPPPNEWVNLDDESGSDGAPRDEPR